MQIESAAHLMAVSVWLAFAATAGLYLYCSGCVTRHLRQFHASAWERLTRPVPSLGYPFIRVPVRPFVGLIWSFKRFRDPELDRLVGFTRLALAACFSAMLASLATVYLFS